jgi:hypothetical protein
MATGDLVGFVVSWPAVNSLTCWAGRLVHQKLPDGEIWALHTVWHLARQDVAGDPPREAAVWETFLTNSSVFQRIGDEGENV